ncbi:MAG: hypothetical protein WBM04_18380 [Candidatus Korobacteraceae bacterium]
MPHNKPDTRDEDIGKGAVEQNEPGQATNISRTGEMGHRNQDALIKSSDSDFPEPGQNEEHTGEPQGRNQLQRDTDITCQDGKRPQPEDQKQNQNKEKNDPLAS